jgi:hypothetical protein
MPYMRRKEIIKKLKSKIHRIYGIYDFKKNKLIAVNLNKESIELEYDMEGYEEDKGKKIVSFDVTLF